MGYVLLTSFAKLKLFNHWEVSEIINYHSLLSVSEIFKAMAEQ